MPRILLRRRALHCVAVTGALFLPICAAAGIPHPVGERVWPSADCSGTLQQCIDAAPANYAVVIASDGPITTNTQIDRKSLHLIAAPGFAPVFAGPSWVDIYATGGNTPTTIRIEGMVLDNGTIHVVQQGSAALTVEIVDNQIQGLDLASDRHGIDIVGVHNGSTGPVTAHILRNTVHLDIPDGFHNIVAVLIGDVPGDTDVLVAGNLISGENQWSFDNAINVTNTVGSLALEVRGNRIEANVFRGGIGLRQDGSGNVVARIINNLVSGVLGEMAEAAFTLRAVDGSTAIEVLNNTLAGNVDGIRVNASGSATVDGHIANNLVAFNSRTGIELFAAGVDNDHNLVFGNGANTYTPGPGTVVADPMFAAPDDFRLQDDSPAIDAGDTLALPLGVFEDIDGGPRVLGARVDIGAYEAVPIHVFGSGFESGE